MRARTRTKKHPFPAGWLLMGLSTCGVLFWWGAQAGSSDLAVIAAFVAVCVAPALLTVTVLWGSFSFFRWFWGGAFD